MNSRPWFVPILAASLALHVAVLLLVRVEPAADVSPVERVPVSLRRVAIRPAPPRKVSERPATRSREAPSPPVPAEPAPLPQEEAEQRPQIDPEPIPPATDTPGIHSSGVTAGVAASAAQDLDSDRVITSVDEAQRVLSELRRLVLEQIVYPPLARRRGIEGRVVLRLALNTDGNADSLTVSRSSGHSILDKAAVELVTRVLPLRPGPGRPLTVDIPIVYLLSR